MKLDDQTIWLRELEFKKNIALAQDKRHFPATYYNFASMLIEEPFIGNKLIDTMNNDFNTKNFNLFIRLAPTQLCGALHRMFNFYIIFN